MKAIYCPLIFILFISISECNSSKQTVTPPNIVAEAFKTKFPEVQKVSWSNEDSGKFEADFKLKDRNFSADFSPIGQWILTEKKIIVSELPATVNRTLEDGFGDYNVASVYAVETAANKNYFKVKLANRQEIKYVNLSYDGVIQDKEESEKEED